MQLILHKGNQHKEKTSGHNWEDSICSFYLNILQNLWYPSASLPEQPYVVQNQSPRSRSRSDVRGGSLSSSTFRSHAFHILYNIRTKLQEEYNWSWGDLQYSYMDSYNNCRGRSVACVLRLCVWVSFFILWWSLVEKMGAKIGQMRWARALVLYISSS